LQNKDEPPSMIVAGSATWSIKDSNASVHALQEYSLNLTRLVQVTSAGIFLYLDLCQKWWRFIKCFVYCHLFMWRYSF